MAARPGKMSKNRVLRVLNAKWHHSYATLHRETGHAIGLPYGLSVVANETRMVDSGTMTAMLPAQVWIARFLRAFVRIGTTRRSGWLAYLVSILVLSACTAIGHVVAEWDEAAIVMVYMLGVVTVALQGRRGPAVLTSLLSALALNYFFLPPRNAFALSGPLAWVTIAMALTGIVVSSLVVQVRRQAQAACQREVRTATLYDLSRHLASAGTAQQIKDIARKHLTETFNCDVKFLNARGRLEQEQDALELVQEEQAAAVWAVENSKVAGMGTKSHPSSRFIFVPLNISNRRPAAMCLGLRDSQPLPADQLQLLTASAALMAAAMERILLAEQVRNSQVQVETERLRSTILSSVSHDLRTPLTAIMGAAGSLAETDSPMPPETRAELLAAISDGAERINCLVGNLLDMMRLESGVLPRKEWLPVEELIVSAISQSEKTLMNHSVQVCLPKELPMLHADPMFMQQVLVNLLENAAKYSPLGSEIELSASAEPDSLVLAVADRGPGVPENMRQSIFEKFVRGQHTRHLAGAGLGLAICRAIAAAHGGRTWVEDRPQGGSIFKFALPREEPPQVEEATQP